MGSTKKVVTDQQIDYQDWIDTVTRTKSGLFIATRAKTTYSVAKHLVISASENQFATALNNQFINIADLLQKL